MDSDTWAVTSSFKVASETVLYTSSTIEVIDSFIYWTAVYEYKSENVFALYKFNADLTNIETSYHIGYLGTEAKTLIIGSELYITAKRGFENYRMVKAVPLEYDADTFTRAGYPSMTARGDGFVPVQVEDPLPAFTDGTWVLTAGALTPGPSNHSVQDLVLEGIASLHGVAPGYGSPVIYMKQIDDGSTPSLKLELPTYCSLAGPAYLAFETQSRPDLEGYDAETGTTVDIVYDASSGTSDFIKFLPLITNYKFGGLFKVVGFRCLSGLDCVYSDLTSPNQLCGNGV